MAKRTAENYLTDQNWDSEESHEDVEEAGQFVAANKAVLQNRQILKAKRRCDASDGKSSNSGIFQGFTGFTASSASTTVTDTSVLYCFQSPPSLDGITSPQRSKLQSLNRNLVSFISSCVTKDPSCNLIPVFDGYRAHKSDILSQGSSSSAADHIPSKNSSLSAAEPRADCRPLSELFKKPVGSWDCLTCCVTNKGEATACVACQMAKPASSSAVTQPAESEKKVKYPSSGTIPLSELFKKSSDEWACPTCMINNKDTANSCVACSTVRPNSSAATSTATSTAAESVSFGPAGGLKFSCPSSQNATTIFKIGTMAATEKPSAQVSGGFTIGGSWQTGSQFSFGNSGQTSSSATTGNDNNEEEEEEYKPVKPDAVTHNEEGAFYSVRCKVFKKTDSGWSDRGTGQLYLKPCNGHTQLLIRADAVTGNILLNIMLSEHLPVTRVGANNVSLVCVLNPPDDKNSKPTTACMLMRVKTVEQADELFSQISRCKKS